MTDFVRRLLLSFLIVIVVAPVRGGASPTSGTSRARAALTDRFVPAALDRVRLDGMLGDRMRVNLEGRLLHVDERRILDGFRHRPGEQDWIGEHAGKFLDAAANTWTNTHDPRIRTLMDRVARQLVASQDADGYLGTYTVERRWTSWDVWVHKYDLIGLLAYAHATSDAAALDAARRVGDLLCRTFGNAPGQRDLVAAGEHVGMAATSVLEPMVRLYSATGEARYLEFCRYLVRADDAPHAARIVRSLTEVGRVDRTANGKAYEMLSNLVGLVELARATDDAALLAPATRAWDDVVAHRRYVTGTASSREHFLGDDTLPGEATDDVGEGCVTVTWAQLTWQLLRVTGDAKYADELERTVFNSLLGAQDPANGDVCYFTPLDGAKPYAHDISCCVSSEPRGISMIPEFAWGARDGGVAVVLYSPGEATIDTSAGDVRVRSATRFPANGAVALTLEPAKGPARFPLFLRVPAWTSRFVANVGGERRVGTPGTFLEIDREWKPGDVVRIDMDLTEHMLPGGASYPNRVAIQRGPQVLALDGRSFAGGGDARLVSVDAAAASDLVELGPARYGVRATVATPSGARRAEQIVLVPYADARVPRVWLARSDVLADEVVRSRADDMKDRPTATAAHARRAPTIDGRLDERAWTVTNAVTAEAIGHHTNDVHFGAMWDATNLYVAVRVLDASLHDDGAHTWESDSVEIYVDGDHNRAGGYDAHDTQVVLVWKGHEVTHNGGGAAPGVVGASAPIGGGYTVEFAIPWSRLGIVPKAGLTIGFDVSNNDNDVGGGVRASKLMWSTPNDDAWRNTSMFGDLVLRR